MSGEGPWHLVWQDNRVRVFASCEHIPHNLMVWGKAHVHTIYRGELSQSQAAKDIGKMWGTQVRIEILEGTAA